MLARSLDKALRPTNDRTRLRLRSVFTPQPDTIDNAREPPVETTGVRLRHQYDLDNSWPGLAIMGRVTDPPDSARLRFRRLVPSDVDRLDELDGEPDVMRYLTGGVPTTPRRQAAILARILDEYDRDVAGRWLAHDAGTGQFVGWFGLDSDTSPPDERELGYRLRSAAWGRGLATEGARALLEFGFGELGLRRIWAQTMAVNTRSRRVLSEAGLQHVRTLHPHFDEPIPGSEQGEVEYEIHRTDRPR